MATPLDRHPRLGALPISHFCSDPLGSDTLRSVSLDLTPSAWALSHRPHQLGPARSTRLSHPRCCPAKSNIWPVEGSAASGALDLGRSGSRPLRPLAAPVISRSVDIWCQARRSPVRSGPRLLRSSATLLLGHFRPFWGLQSSATRPFCRSSA